MLRLGAAALAAGWRAEAQLREDDLPAVVRRRESWGAASTRGDLRRHAIERVTLHHTGPPPWFGAPPSATYLRQIQAFHQGPERRWPDIAYHLLIDLDGTVWEGRPLDAIGDTATAYDPTGHALVALLGDYDVQQVNEAQRSALVESVRWLVNRFAVDPTSVAAHRDYASTACPGRNLYVLLPEIQSFAAGTG